MRSVAIFSFLFLATAFIAGCAALTDRAAPEAEEEARYLPGGPLAGEELPRFPTKHGEPAGHPGSIPELAEEAREEDPESRAYTPQGQYPQLQLYDGSIEHFRAYWFKYTPSRGRADRMSLVRNFIVSELPGMDEMAEEYAEPVYWVRRHGYGTDTGYQHEPVNVVRAVADWPEFKLDLGELERGMYVVRVIGAVEKEHHETFRLPLYIRLTVNNGKNGEVNSYRQRIGYVDQFYSVSEIYFHAPETREYSAAVRVDEGSEIPLLIHNIDVHDILAGAERRAIKTEMTLTTPEEREQIRSTAEDEGVRVPFRVSQRASSYLRQRAEQAGLEEIEDASGEQKRAWQDDYLWHSLPPVNSQPGGIYGRQRGYRPGTAHGAEGKTMEEIAKEHGEWTQPRNQSGPVLLVNEKLGLEYTTKDLAAGRSLPDPYPYKDDGASLYFPAPDEPAEEDQDEPVPQNFTVVADAVAARYRVYSNQLNQLADHYHRTGDEESGRDAAMLLIRIAYHHPSLANAHALSTFIRYPADWGRDQRFRQRVLRPFYFNSLQYVENYDKLFDVIDGNQELAEAVSRFIPWVETPDDIIELIDVYLVQDAARRIMRYQIYASNQPTYIMRPVIALNDPSVTGEWMEWLFTRTFVYPNTPSGLHDLLITAHCRDGRGYIASTYYAHGQESSGDADVLGRYVDLGGDPQYDLRDPDLYPKVTESTYWPIRIRMAGLYFPRMGSVGGPDKSYGYLFDRMFGFSRRGWRWTKDPDFAFILKHYAGREDETDEEWAEIEEAAEGRRAPWLENRSRMIPNWMGALESGIEHDDFRFRRAAMLRIGQGWGHHHNDTLDLQIMAHGYPMTVDGGQRPGYSAPGDRTTRIHNLVEVDGKQWLGHSWVNAISDMPGARYLSAEAVPPANHEDVSLYRRQLALIDVDEGEGSQPLEPEQLTPGARLETEGIVTANSYVVDFVRVQGGEMHTYAFHAMVDDQFETNLLEKQDYDEMPEEEQSYLEGFRQRDRSFTGDAPDTVMGTWRMTREDGVFGREQRMASSIWDEDSPRKFTRLYVLGQEGARALSAWHESTQFNYGMTNLFVQHRHGEQSGIVYPVVIEPYAGEPFIENVRLIDIPDNENDALKAAAVEVKTVNGHRDVIFSDGRPYMTREVEDLRIAGEYAFYSTDDEGLRMAGVTGGQLLESDDVVIEPVMGERAGEVIEVDYQRKQMVIDSADWPRGERLKDQVFEVGRRDPARMTAYTLAGVEDDPRGSRLNMLRGADFYLSRVEDVDSEERIVECSLAISVNEGRPSPGMDKNWVASNEEGTKFWRAEYLGREGEEGGYRFRLDGDVSRDDFGDYGALRLWEYGVGDRVRQSTFVHLKRVDNGTFEVYANVPFSLTLNAAGVEIKNGGEWIELENEKQGVALRTKLDIDQLDESGRAQIRLR